MPGGRWCRQRSRFLEASLGVIDTKALFVVAELGIADLLADGAKTPTDLAGACDADADAPDGRILVLEATMPSSDGDHLVKALDLEMLVDTGAGRERTRKEFDDLFARAGLRVRRVIRIVLTRVSGS